MHRNRDNNLIYRRPFWLPASNFYVLAVAVTLAVFFLIWGVLHDGGEETPFVPAGLGASVVLASAVVLREVVLRRARNRFLAHQRSLDRSVAGIAPRRAGSSDPGKLTLERNAVILRTIADKSEAAKTLGRLSSAHREVFDLCEEYLALTHRELPSVGVGSPRLAAIRRGQDRVEELRHYHLLQWASIETRSLTAEAKVRSNTEERLDLAQRALGVVDFASSVYPGELSLRESAQVLKEFLASVKVADLVQKAERSAFKGNNQRAIGYYKDALFELSIDQPAAGEGRDVVTERIRSEIERLEAMASGAKKDVYGPKQRRKPPKRK